jgi:hypothetical protein
MLIVIGTLTAVALLALAFMAGVHHERTRRERFDQLILASFEDSDAKMAALLQAAEAGAEPRVH